MRIVLVLALVAALGAAGCGKGDDGAAGDDGRLTVVAAFFPLAEAARQVGGDSVEVVDLTPPGVEPHDLEVTSDLIDEILDADVAVVMGRDFQPAVEDAAAGRDGPTIEVLDALDLSGGDPHVWLDPTRYAEMVDVIAEAVHADARAVRAYKDELTALDERFEATLSTCEQRVLVASHESYGYLAARYGLRQESITGLIPEEEPDPSKLDDLARLVEREHVTTVFNEPLLPRRAAETLAAEAHVHVASLDPLESDPGDGYVGAMDENLAVLAAGLGCDPPGA
jgi:zinc transport system substrate-binding protein